MSSTRQIIFQRFPINNNRLFYIFLKSHYIITLLFFIFSIQLSFSQIVTAEEIFFPPYDWTGGNSSGEYASYCVEGLCSMEYGNTGNSQAGEMQVKTYTASSVSGETIASAYQRIRKTFTPDLTGTHKITFVFKLKGYAGAHSTLYHVGGSLAETKVSLNLSVLYGEVLLDQENIIYNYVSMCLNPFGNQLIEFDDQIFEATGTVYLIAGRTYDLYGGIKIISDSYGLLAASSESVAYFSEGSFSWPGGPGELIQVNVNGYAKIEFIRVETISVDEPAPRINKSDNSYCISDSTELVLHFIMNNAGEYTPWEGLSISTNSDRLDIISCNENLIIPSQYIEINDNEMLIQNFPVGDSGHQILNVNNQLMIPINQLLEISSAF